MERYRYRNIGILTVITLLLFYPLFYVHYFYTDEVLQLWNYRKGSGFAMFTVQGRYITDILFRYLYSHIDSIRQLSGLRIFSLIGWICCLPIWYMIIDKVCRKEGLSSLIPFFSVLYLITSLPFEVGVQWASCMELSIANTAGLLSGYILYVHIRLENGRVTVPNRGIFLAMLPGLVALFTYQNGFGCFLLPFFLQGLAQKKAPRSFLLVLFVYFLTYGVYFLLFLLQRHFGHFTPDARGGFVDNPLAKIYFMFAKPLGGAFYFNWIVRENNFSAHIVYMAVFAICLAVNLRHTKGRLGYIIFIIGSFFLVYLPSLVVHENYASNRTLLALDMTVFTWVFTTLLKELRDRRRQMWGAAILGALLVGRCWYNFHYVFLQPAKEEYEKIKGFVEAQYRPGMVNVEYIQTSEDRVRTKYGISSSWDEFGMSSSYFKWVPEVLVRQLIFEKTGDRSTAEKISVKSWQDKSAWLGSPHSSSPETLVIDVEDILR